MIAAANIPREPLAELLEREIAARNDPDTGLGGVEVLAMEVAAGGEMTQEAAQRRLYSIRSGNAYNRDGTPAVQATVTFDVADRILTALGLQDEWHVSLAPWYETKRNGEPPAEAFCRTCEEWTLGQTCGWCDSRTVTAERMLERKRAGRCELTGRAVRGMTRGHRLARSCEHLAAKLGRPVEERLGLTEQPAKKGGPLVFRRGNLTREHVALLHRVYREERLGIPTIARMVWHQLGFPSEVSCSNALNRAFHHYGLAMRAREDRTRTEKGRRRVGFGGKASRRVGGRVLTGAEVDELWALYEAGESSHAVCRAHFARFGYPDAEAFRGMLEHAWKVTGRKLRSPREATFLARERAGRRCAAVVRKSEQRPYPCRHLPMKGSDYCLHHDPERREEVVARALRTAAMRQRKPTVEWTELEPHLRPLMVPRPDRFGRQLEKPGGALARNTGLDPAVCSRLVNGRHPRVTVDTANKLLEPLRLTVEAIREARWPQAA